MINTIEIGSIYELNGGYFKVLAGANGFYTLVTMRCADNVFSTAAPCLYSILSPENTDAFKANANETEE